jgi:magnesium transporter
MDLLGWWRHHAQPSRTRMHRLLTRKDVKAWMSDLSVMQVSSDMRSRNSRLLERRDAVIWVDIPVCDQQAAYVLSEVFGFHPIAVRDCVERNHVSKVHIYPDYVFSVLHAPKVGKRGHVHYVELDQFVGKNYLVTVHGPLNPVVDPEVAFLDTKTVVRRLEKGQVRMASPFELSYGIVSAMIRREADLIAELAKESGLLEQRVTLGEHLEDPEAFLEELFQAWYALLAIRTMATHSSATYGRMARLVRFLPDAAPPLFADIADQFEVIQTMADGQREFLHGVIEFYQTVLSVHATLLGQTQNEKVQQLTEAGYAQNEEIKKISSWAAIFFAPTLIGTIYGMNFDHMPELRWVIGYPLALLGMVLGSVALYLMFKRLKWL